jgi:hypothetical protein
MTDEVSVVIDESTGERIVDMPEEHGTTADACYAEQESLIMPEQEDDLQESMLEDTSVDTVSTTGLFYRVYKEIFFIILHYKYQRRYVHKKLNTNSCFAKLRAISNLFSFFLCTLYIRC